MQIWPHFPLLKPFSHPLAVPFYQLLQNLWFMSPKVFGLRVYNSMIKYLPALHKALVLEISIPTNKKKIQDLFCFEIVFSIITDTLRVTELLRKRTSPQLSGLGLLSVLGCLCLDRTLLCIRFDYLQTSPIARPPFVRCLLKRKRCVFVSNIFTVHSGHTHTFTFSFSSSSLLQ